MESKEKNILRLHEVRQEEGNVKTFIFEHDGLEWKPGQYQGYSLPISDVPEERERWFTIASAPREHFIHISTRVSESAFKQALDHLKVGDTIESYELGGDFLWEKSDKEAVFIAGGIGITPFRSMIVERDLAGLSIPVTLIYFNRTHEIPFHNEFKAIQERHPEFVLKEIVGENISTERIFELAPDGEGKTFFLSGPEGMVEAVGNNLESRGVHVKRDWFPGYDEHNF